MHCSSSNHLLTVKAVLGCTVSQPAKVCTLKTSEPAYTYNGAKALCTIYNACEVLPVPETKQHTTRSFYENMFKLSKRVIMVCEIMVIFYLQIVV